MRHSLTSHAVSLEQVDSFIVDQSSPLAEQGNLAAQSLLGYKYYNGEGVPKDYQQAVKWFRLASEQGEAHAQFKLGLWEKSVVRFWPASGREGGRYWIFNWELRG